MPYHLYAVDESGKSAAWTHNEKGHAALHLPDDQRVTIVLEHPTTTTYMILEADGSWVIETEEEE